MDPVVVKPMFQLIQGDCLDYLKTMERVKCIFADPPDNLGLPYTLFEDKVSPREYLLSLESIIRWSLVKSDIFWLSVYHAYHLELGDLIHSIIRTFHPSVKVRLLLWRFTFGQYNDQDFASGYRLIYRFTKPGVRLYPDQVRVDSRRMELGDKRAVGPRLPDDVWEFPRVVGNAKERRMWHPTQHPEALLERIVKYSCQAGEEVCDLFAGTGTTARVCSKLGVNWTGIEISPYYCKKIIEENPNVQLITSDAP